MYKFVLMNEEVYWYLDFLTFVVPLQTNLPLLRFMKVLEDEPVSALQMDICIPVILMRESSTPQAAAVVAAPTLKLCPE